MKKKWTVIYSTWIGNYGNHMVSYKLLEGEDFDAALDAAQVDVGEVWHVFEGHVTEAREWVGEDYNEHSDCSQCGHEAVWVNAQGKCSRCVD